MPLRFSSLRRGCSWSPSIMKRASPINTRKLRLHIIEELLASMHDANIHQRIAGDIFDKKVHVLTFRLG